MSRFVILQHVTLPGAERTSHYDLMLEQDGKLLTWAIGDRPSAGLQCVATRLPDHRLAYLDYEGAISGNRGEVTRVDAGEYTCSQLDAMAAKFELRGLSGQLQVVLRHESGDQWTADFSAD